MHCASGMRTFCQKFSLVFFRPVHDTVQYRKPNQTFRPLHGSVRFMVQLGLLKLFGQP